MATLLDYTDAFAPLLRMQRSTPPSVPADQREFVQSAREKMGIAAAVSLHPTAGHGDRIKFFLSRVTADLFYAEEALRRDPQVACRRGCATCCHFSVLVSAPEVLDLVAWLRATLPAVALDALARRTADLAEKVRSCSPKERWEKRIPCPMLSYAGECQGYKHRPVICRTYNSDSAQRCATAEPGVGMHRSRVDVNAVGVGTAQGIAEGCTYIGLDGHPLELTLALDVALSTPDVERRWLAGEDVFSPAWQFPPEEEA